MEIKQRDHKELDSKLLASIDQIGQSIERTATGIIWTPEKYAVVLKAFQGGVRKSELARRLGLSRQRVHEMLAKAQRIDKTKDSLDSLDALTVQAQILSIQAQNCLKSADVCTVGELRAVITNGKFENIPGLGIARKSEILKWLNALP